VGGGGGGGGICKLLRIQELRRTNVEKCPAFFFIFQSAIRPTAEEKKRGLKRDPGAACPSLHLIGEEETDRAFLQET